MRNESCDRVGVSFGGDSSQEGGRRQSLPLARLPRFILVSALQHQHWLCRLSAQRYYFRSLPASLICIALDISATIPSACIPVFLHRFNVYDSAVSASIPSRHIFCYIVFFSPAFAHIQPEFFTFIVIL
ncbi:hypothetical protein C8R48DRAFT_693963 [Suillus tomentosus]|nr:hypothetical protein C8R48DRAFT_693963 [Suillus tomentosus]